MSEFLKPMAPIPSGTSMECKNLRIASPKTFPASSRFTLEISTPNSCAHSKWRSGSVGAVNSKTAGADKATDIP